MSGLRQSFLELIRTIGNNSGCHQMAERSFFYKGRQFPVCARCTGVFIGHFLSIVLFFLKKQIPFRSCCILIAIMGADWTIQEAGIKPSTNRRRVISGFCGGLGLFSIYALIINKLWSLFIKARFFTYKSP